MSTTSGYDGALALARAGDWDGALPAFFAVLRADPNHPGAVLKVFGYARKHGKPEVLDELLACVPTPSAHPESNFRLAEAARIRGRFDDAERYRAAAEAGYRAALDHNSANWRSHQMLGELYYYFSQPDRAITCYDDALQYAPEKSRPGVLSDRGMAYRAVRRYDEAGRDFRAALALDASHGSASFNLALLLLLLGQYPEGLELYERRRVTPGAAPERTDPARWAGRTVAITAEQGLGDQIQMARYVRRVAERAGRVYVTCDKSLIGLLERCPGVGSPLLRGSALPAHDVSVPVMSLPYVFGTDLRSLPGDHYPYLPRDGWALPNLGPLKDAVCEPGVKKAGVVWCGNPFNIEDHHRSCPLAALAPLFSTPGIRWFALQPDPRPGDADLLRAHGVHDLGPVIRGSFAATAAMIERLDCVVTVDSAVAHLAGAMGKRVLVALAYDPDWRWGHEGDTTPWYPSAVLVRQPGPGDWGAVVARIRDLL